jgi:hypothetical protein
MVFPPNKLALRRSTQGSSARCISCGTSVHL